MGSLADQDCDRAVAFADAGPAPNANVGGDMLRKPAGVRSGRGVWVAIKVALGSNAVSTLGVGPNRVASPTL